MGNDYYVTNEHLVPSHGPRSSPPGEIFGYYVITRQYLRALSPARDAHRDQPRRTPERAPGWLWKEWANMVRLQGRRRPDHRLHLVQPDRPGGLGHRLREDNGHVNPLGLYDLDRKIRPVGRGLQGAGRAVAPHSADARVSACTTSSRRKFETPDEELLS